MKDSKFEVNQKVVYIPGTIYAGIYEHVGKSYGRVLHYNGVVTTVQWSNASGVYANRPGVHICECLRLAAPDFGPIPCREDDFVPLPYDALILGEVYEYRLPQVNQNYLGVDYIRRTDKGVWLHFTSAGFASSVSLRDVGGVRHRATNWVYFTDNSHFISTQSWLTNGYGSFVPSYSWPSMASFLEKAFNNLYLSGEPK